MSTALADRTAHDDETSLARTLGLVRGTLPPLPLPPLEQHLVPGASPLEASGWATGTDA